MTRSASKQQTWRIFCITKQDVRPHNLTYDQAYQIVAELQRTGKATLPDGTELSGPMQVDKSEYEQWIKEAHEAGMAAAQAVRVRPMVVTQHADQLDDQSPIVKAWYVSQGVCGMAWITVRDARKRFTRWLIDTEKARHSDYHGGAMIWVSQFNQSYELKSAYARAYADSLSEHGVKCYAGSRLD